MTIPTKVVEHVFNVLKRLENGLVKNDPHVRFGLFPETPTMRFLSTRIVPVVLLFACVFTAWGADERAGAKADGVLIGHDRFDGLMLLRELNCVACHAAPEHPVLVERPAPRLSNVGSRVSPDYLRTFLSQPHLAKAGTPMPDALAGLSGEQKTAAVESLVHYLVSLGGPMDIVPRPVTNQEIAEGKALYHSVGCVACHQAFIPPPTHPEDRAVVLIDDEDDEKPVAIPKPQLTLAPLGDLAKKTARTPLAVFLSSPVGVRPSGRMPGLGLNAHESSAIAAFLLRDQVQDGKLVPPASTFQPDPQQVQLGKQLFAAHGCAACHSSGKWPGATLLDLATMQARAEGFARSGNSSPSNEEPKHAIDGNPKTKYLNFGAAGSGIVIHVPGPPKILIGLGITSANDYPERDPTAVLIEGSVDGKTFERITEQKLAPFAERFENQQIHFDNLTPHRDFRITFTQIASQTNAMQVAEIQLLAGDPPKEDVKSTLTAKPLAALNVAAAAGCLTDRRQGQSPRFALDVKQRTAVRDALERMHKLAPSQDSPSKNGPSKDSSSPLAADERIDLTMNALNCYACHARGMKGGATAERANYFGYQVVVEFGQEGRLPPMLSDVGAKLTQTGFADMLFSGQKYRTYMATRMPQFGRDNVGTLPAAFMQADAGKVPPHEPKFSAKLAEDGRTLVGKTHLSCINCHAWGPHRLPGAEGLDLLKVRARLQPGWFHALVRDPMSVRPGTRMPAGFPFGKTSFPQMQEGRVDLQIDALWAYITAGERAGLPPGINPKPTSGIVIGDEPVVFRTFVNGLGAHAIAVGFRQRTHLVFDADRIKTSAAWSGDFVSTQGAWEGRGGNYARIEGTGVLKFPEGPAFARLPSANSEWPTDPPKPAAHIQASRTPEGWRFRGYRYTPDRVPVFRYDVGPVSVEETPSTQIVEHGACLMRRFELKSAEDVPDLFFRIALGKKIEQVDGFWVVDGTARYRVTGGEPQLRTNEKDHELILPITFTPGPHGRTTQFQVEVLW
jgi:cbb3-type cytochrome oxidase cytochrome c subunit